jgi:hypothetical protein
MRALLISDEIKNKLRDQAEWANQKANWYVAFKDQEPPGDNPAFVVMLEHGFRTVYSRTVMPSGKNFTGKHFRHLSISVEGEKYPNPTAVFTIAVMYGFTGAEESTSVKDTFSGGVYVKPGADWIMATNEEEHCVTVAQEIDDADCQV